MGYSFRITLLFLWSIAITLRGEVIEIGSYGGKEGKEISFGTFRKYQGKAGTFYLFDLERNGRFFNGLLYRSLRLEGVRGQWRVALADWRMAMREANLIVGENRRTFQLTPLALRLDLQRLKYVVLFTEEPVEGLKVRFVDPLPRSVPNKKMQLAAWVWNGEEIGTDPLLRWGIDRIYLQYTAKFSQIVSQWKKKKNSLEVYALSGTVEEIYEPGKLIRRWENLPWKELEGVQLDVEPYLLPEYRIHPGKILNRYLKFVREIGAWVRRRGKKLSLAVPFWFQDIVLDEVPLLRKIFRYADEVVVMSYRNRPSEVLRLSNVFLRWGEIMGKKVSIGIELLPVPHKGDTIRKMCNRALLSSAL